MNIEMNGLSNQGSRSHNEDSLFLPQQLSNAVIQSKGYLFIVADGVGGHQAGEVASKMAVEVISQTYYSDPNPDVRGSLQAAIEKANQHIFQAAKRNNDDRPRTMATTVAAAVIRGNDLTAANVGDSRVYLISNGRVEQLTSDHSWVGEQMKAGILTPEQAKNHPQKNVVTRSLGHKLEVQVDAYPPRPIGPGHTILLCSDGLPAVVDDSDIGQIVSQSRSPQEMTKKLVDLTLERGAPDNVTTIVVNFGGPAVAVVAAAPTIARTISTSMAQVRPPTPQKSGKTLPVLLLIGAVGLAILLLGGIGLTLLWFNRSASAPASVAKSEVIIEPTVAPAPTDTPKPLPTQAPATASPLESSPIMTPTEVTTTVPTTKETINPLTLIAPENGATLTRGNNADPITVLRWSGYEINPANQEQFMVSIRSSNGQNSGLPNQGITLIPEYSVPGSFPVGQYSWLVVAQKKNEAGNFEEVSRSSINSFSIKGATSTQPQQSKTETETASTPSLPKRTAVSLISPPEGDSFVGPEATFQLSWSESFPALAADEYYVLIINHNGGEDRTWRKEPYYDLPKEKDWLIGMGPDLHWQVIVAQKRTNDPNEDPRGAERSEWGQERKFIWATPGPKSDGGKDKGEGGGSGGTDGR